LKHLHSFLEVDSRNYQFFEVYGNLHYFASSAFPNQTNGQINIHNDWHWLKSLLIDWVIDCYFESEDCWRVSKRKSFQEMK
jgi:hypothetical protein